ncbi:hypothetical protein [Flammeovirga sp. EKP202]|uniref:hypothetical protein n=1 Tax=Flammeovirga sp. EKP202 TaxID=2770592 RepID=UPI00165F9976|nr:hypothetical protein [Flammeovirga sp. EKP202]MBD0405348.1 hypothetical protein [Flammeovirga sp. EKP202]
MYFFAIVFALFLFHQNLIYAQGCSDAGICTTGALNPENDGENLSYFENKFTVDYLLYYQLYQDNQTDRGIGLAVNYHLNRRNSFQIKTNYAIKESPLTRTSGLGDITLAYSYALLQTDKWQISTVIGGKIPTSDADISLNGLPLPMYFNTSLGTYDALFGFAISSKAWHFSFGYQQPLTTASKHEYDPDYWSEQPNYKWMQNWYPATRHLDRKADVSGRVKYTLRTSKWSLSPSVLAIYKLENGYVESLNNGNYDFEGSDGLALNILVEGSYNFSPYFSMGAVAGYAAVQRPFNPDGLARDYVFNLLLKHQF